MEETGYRKDLEPVAFQGQNKADETERDLGLNLE
jgi:hypothetical protein